MCTSVPPVPPIVLKLILTVKRELSLEGDLFSAAPPAAMPAGKRQCWLSVRSSTAIRHLHIYCEAQKMAQHFLRSKAYRDFTDDDFESIDEHTAWEWFVRERWGDLKNVCCPACNTVGEHWLNRQRKQWRCKHCNRVFSVTSETPFARRRLPFRKLLKLIFWFVSDAKGLAATKAARDLNVVYRTAFQNLNKIREAIHGNQDRTPLTGHVQIDGGHFCGKPRRPRHRRKMTTEIANHHLKNRKAGMVPGISKMTMEPWNVEKLTKRRIVLVITQLGASEGEGSTRTITCILRAENAEEAVPKIRKYVADGATIHTDDGRAFSSLSAWYDHSTVRHSVEYSTLDGVNNNQAEGFMSRLRRAEYGIHHGMRHQYFAFYAAETAWRIDNRRVSIKQKLQKLLLLVLQSDISLAFRGYCQGHRLGFEYLG